MQYSKQGELHLIYGPMRSGKSTKLFMVSTHELILGKNSVCTFIPAISKMRKDPIYEISSKLKVEFIGNIDDDEVVISDDEFLLMSKFQIILIDEAQFISNLVDVVKKLLDLGKKVMVSSLCGDYNGKLIGKMHELLPEATSIEKITGYCDPCSSIGLETTSVASIRVSGSDDLIDVNAKYIAACRNHATKYRSNPPVKYDHLHKLLRIKSVRRRAIDRIKANIA